MNMPVFYGTLITIAFASLFIGTKKDSNKENYNQYFLGGRSLKIFPLTLTFLATQLGGGAILGGAEAAFRYGWHAIYYALGISCGLFILALGVGKKFRQLNVATIPEIFGKTYKLPRLQVLSSLILIYSSFFILVALGVATRKFFSAIGVENEFWFIGFWAVIITYTTFGGFGAVVKTDILQILFVLLAFALVLIFMLINPDLPLVNNLSIASNIYSESSLPWNTWLLMPMFFTVIGQDMGQRCFSAKEPKTVSLATAYAGMILFVASLLPVSLGVLARFYNMEVTDAGVLIELLSKITNPYITSIFAGAVLLGILSTADSLVCSISSNVSYDLFGYISFKKSKNKTSVARITTFIIGALTILFALYYEEIISTIVHGYTFAICCLFIPVLFAAILPNRRTLPVTASFYTGVTGYFVFSYLYPINFKEIYILVLAFMVYWFLYIKKCDSESSNT